VLPITRRGVITQPRGILRITQNGVIALTTAGSPAPKSTRRNGGNYVKQYEGLHGYAARLLSFA